MARRSSSIDRAESRVHAPLQRFSAHPFSASLSCAGGRLQSIHGEPDGAGGAAAEREDQRGEHQAVPEAEEGRGQRGGQVQPQSGRAGLRHLRESGGRLERNYGIRRFSRTRQRPTSLSSGRDYWGMKL